MRRRGRRRLILATVALLVCLGLAASAVAFWSKAGGGGGAGTAGSALAVTVSAGTPGAALYPGGQSDVALVISNPNPFAAHVGSLSLDATQGASGFAVDAGHGACSTSVLSFSTQTNGGAGWTVAPKVGASNGVLSLDLPGALSMNASALSACQGATFTVYLVAGP